MSKRINYNASFSYGTAIELLDPVTRRLVTPTLGQLTGVTLRLATTPTGFAADGTTSTVLVSGLAATEASGVPGEFAFTLSQAQQQQYLKPLGPDVDYYAIWSGPGFDDFAVHYRTAESTPVT